MTDINKLIEEEAERHISQFNTFEYKEYDDLISWGYEGTRVSSDANQLRDRAFMNGFKAGANFILHQNRWRKLSDLLELKESGFHILTRVPDEKKMFYYTTMYLGNEEDLDVIKYMLELELGKDPSYGDHLEWKPIE